MAKNSNSVTAVYKIPLLSESWDTNIEQSVKGFPGVEGVKAEIVLNKLTVVGKMDPTMLRDKLSPMTKQGAELVSPLPPKGKKTKVINLDLEMTAHPEKKEDLEIKQWMKIWHRNLSYKHAEAEIVPPKKEKKEKQIDGGNNRGDGDKKDGNGGGSCGGKKKGGGGDGGQGGGGGGGGENRMDGFGHPGFGYHDHSYGYGNGFVNGHGHANGWALAKGTKYVQ
ncbi:hypothetical protein SO802_014263 [Lithocarpus litseifolius]|uniref:HMA domain-containing protein n=1 Tax=Lithocarpus litseifolius TaxID=425828 RepID=A0AAW2CSM6_9ROSI